MAEGSWGNQAPSRRTPRLEIDPQEIGAEAVLVRELGERPARDPGVDLHCRAKEVESLQSDPEIQIVDTLMNDGVAGVHTDLGDEQHAGEQTPSFSLSSG